MATPGAGFRTSKSGGIDISILGDKLLQKKFKELEKTMQKKIAQKALRKGGDLVVKFAKARVAVSAVKKPGQKKHLKDTIKRVNIKRTKKGAGVIVLTGTRKQLGIKADDTGYYPFSLEFGTANARAQPYLRPAIDQRDTLLDAIRAELWDGIRKVGRKGVGL